MPSLADLVPEIAAFQQAQNQGQQQQMGRLQQAGALQGILAKVQEAKREQEYRGALSALGPNPTADQISGVALQFGGPKEALQHADRVTANERTKQIAFQNLQQKVATEARHAYEFAQTLPLRERQTAAAEINARANADMKAGGLEISAGNYNYNTGGNTSNVMQLVEKLRGMGAAPMGGAPAAAPAQPAPQGVDFNFNGMRGTAPDEATATTLMQNLMRGGGAPAAAPAAQPTAAPVAPEQPMLPPAAPNNLDALDLGAGARGPVMPITPTAAAIPAPPPAPVMPTFSGSPRDRAAAENRWKNEQAKTSIAGAGKLTPEALTDVAAQYLAGDRQAISGFARDQATKSAIQNEISKQMRAKGWTGPDVAAQMADFAGIMSGSRTVGTRAAQIELASSEADKMIDIARNRSKAFERTQFVPVNVAIKAFETNTGQPEVKAFGAAINSLVNVYARAISPSGVPTVSDKDHAREMLASVDSVEQFKAVTDVMREEMKAARDAPLEVRRATRKAVTGNAGAGGFDADKERRYQEWKARQK